jgi:hypothetical protein
MRAYLGYAYNATGQFDAAIRIIETSGLLDSYSHSRRNAEESDGFLVLIDAAYGSGEIDSARELAAWRLETHYESVSADWWIALEHACTQAILGNDVEVHHLLQRAQEGNHLAWEPMLKDHQCFKRFADDPVYLATVRHFDERRALLRARLPTTLAQHGVTL